MLSAPPVAPALAEEAAALPADEALLAAEEAREEADETALLPAAEALLATLDASLTMEEVMEAATLSPDEATEAAPDVMLARMALSREEMEERTLLSVAVAATLERELISD